MLHRGDSNEYPHHLFSWTNIIEPPHDKTNKMACAPSEDSDHCPHEESFGP